MTSVRPESIGQRIQLPEIGQLGDCRNPTLRWILSGFDENFDHKITELKTTWNQKVRAFYRETLSVNTKKSPLTISVKLDDHGAFVRLIEKSYPYLDFAEFVALRKYVAEAENVKAYFSGLPAEGALAESSEYAAELLNTYDLKKIIESLFEFYSRSPDSDVFGKYNLRTHSIEIYILPCIIFSMLIEEDFMDMAIGTLAHELAHGFQHVGADKDEVIWDNFENVEPALVEGLAEFYAREFAESVIGARPTVLETFNKTSKYLPEAYRRYEQWTSDVGLETVYQALVQVRRNDVQTFDEFELALDDAAQRLEIAR